MSYNYNNNDDNDDDVKIYPGTLSSIFKKNQKYTLRELNQKKKEKLAEELPAVVVVPVDVQEGIVLNSKLRWLNSGIKKMDDQLSITFKNDFPVLDHFTKKVVSFKEEIIEVKIQNVEQSFQETENPEGWTAVNHKRKSQKVCPKIRDGHNCIKEKCSYEHPKEKEVKEIVSNMRSLKRRVVKDVLKIITNSPSEEPQESSSSSISIQFKPKQSVQGKTKLCKFMDKCKYKNKCNYAHSESELILNECQFGSRCRLVKNGDDGYVNNNGKCSFLHPRETREMYFTRNK